MAVPVAVLDHRQHVRVHEPCLAGDLSLGLPGLELLDAGANERGEAAPVVRAGLGGHGVILLKMSSFLADDLVIAIP